MLPKGHRIADLRSLALHSAVARRVRENPALLDAVQARVQRWRLHGDVAPYYVAAWEALLNGPREELLATLVRDDEHAL